MYLKTIFLCTFIVINSVVESARDDRPKVNT